MKYENLGRTGLQVSQVCLGTMTFGAQADEKESQRIIDTAWDAGVNFFDTADVYVDGQSEQILGKFLKDRRSQAVIATKVRGRVGPGPNDVGLSRKHIMDAVESSLRRLQTDYIDLYQVHSWDADTPLEETMSALDDLVRQGKVRYIGCSNFTAWQLMKSLWISDVNNLSRFDSHQPRFNLLKREIEGELLPACAAEGVGVIPYNPLGGGLLTGKHTKGEPPAPDTRFGLREVYRDLYWQDPYLDAMEKLRAIAAEHGKSMIQLAIGWILSNPVVTSAIVGASRADQLSEPLEALDVTLSPEEMAACDKVWDELQGRE